MKIDPRIFLQLDRRQPPSNAELGVRNNAATTLKMWPRQDQWSDTTWRLLHKDAGQSLAVTNSLSQDQAAIARRKAAEPLKPSKPQLPADHGLFDDAARNQLDLIELLMDPVED